MTNNPDQSEQISAKILGENFSCGVVNAHCENGKWIADCDDPQVIVHLTDPLPAGWVEIRAEIKSKSKRPDPRIYFDFGDGYSEVYASRLELNRKHNRYILTAKLPWAVNSIRLDPVNAPGEFAVISFEVRSISLPKVAYRLSRRGFAVLRADPKGFFAQLPKYIDALRQPRFLRLEIQAAGAIHGAASYEDWIERHDFDLERDAGALRAQIDACKNKPLISVIMPVYNTPERLLVEAIESVRSQVYTNWELCIADDRSTNPHVRRVLERYLALDPRIKVEFREKNGHISHATNSAFELTNADWVALLDHDDLLRPNSLAEVVFEINRHPTAQLIYSDEDKLDTRGNRYDPYFKPDFSRELFRSQNYLNHLTVHRSANIRAVGGWRPGYEGSQDYDLSLRIFERINPSTIRHIPKVLYHWRAVVGSTAVAGSEKNYAHTAGRRALEDHVRRMQLSASVEEAPDTPFFRLRFSLPKRPPLVSLIVPTRDKANLLRGSVGTILEKTTYPNYEIIIVDNGSVERATFDYFAELSSHKNVRVLSYEKPFNYSAINNFAVANAKGSVVGLINNDVEVISPGWLDEMVSWAIQPDVGCVGAKLYYGNDTIQHAGVYLGIGGVAGHSHKHFARRQSGYFARLKILQNVSAVTAACLVIRKQLFESVHGLDEKNLVVAFNDVDFCLRIREQGYLNVWTPYAELYHLESISRGYEDNPEKISRFNREVEYMKSSWGNKLINDPYYSQNLSLDNESMTIRE